MQSTVRAREMAVRISLGAARLRVLKQLLTEALLAALASGVVAVAVAYVALEIVRGVLPGDVTFFAPYEIGIERRTVLFTFCLAVAVGTLFGLLPAWRAGHITDHARDVGWLLTQVADVGVLCAIRPVLFVSSAVVD